MNFNIILCIDNKGGISKNNVIPWHIKLDLTFFKFRTTGNNNDNAVIMGYNTYLSIKSVYKNGLPNRLTIIITSKKLDNKNKYWFSINAVGFNKCINLLTN